MIPKINFMAHHFSIGFLNSMTFKVSIIAIIIPLTLLLFFLFWLNFLLLYFQDGWYLYFHNRHNIFYILSQVILEVKKSINGSVLLFCKQLCRGQARKYTNIIHIFSLYVMFVSLGYSWENVPQLRSNGLLFPIINHAFKNALIF